MTVSSRTKEMTGTNAREADLLLEETKPAMIIAETMTETTDKGTEEGPTDMAQNRTGNHTTS